MQTDRSADGAHLAASVRGLGVCDVLRVELAPCQHAALEDALAARAAALKPELAALEARVTAGRRSGPRGQRLLAAPTPDELELAALRADVRTLDQVRASVPARPAGPAGPVALLAPAGMALELVSTCLRSAVAALAASLDDAPSGRVLPSAQLEAAAAWIATALDCRAVETFCLEPGLDPLRAA